MRRSQWLQPFQTQPHSTSFIIEKWPKSIFIQLLNSIHRTCSSRMSYKISHINIIVIQSATKPCGDERAENSSRLRSSKNPPSDHPHGGMCDPIKAHISSPFPLHSLPQTRHHIATEIHISRAKAALTASTSSISFLIDETKPHWHWLPLVWPPTRRIHHLADAGCLTRTDLPDWLSSLE